MYFSWEFFGFIVFATLKPGVNMLSQGALADPVWGDVPEGRGQSVLSTETYQTMNLFGSTTGVNARDFGFKSKMLWILDFITGKQLVLAVYSSY